MTNPYLDRYKATSETHDYVSAFGARRSLVTQYSWAIPNQEAIDLIVSCGPIIEVGAGSGYWAKLIRESGGDIIASEPFFQEENTYVDVKPYTILEVKDWKIVKDYPGRTLLTIWPPMSDWCYYMLRAYKGDKVIYIGEGGSYGCTGGEKFHRYLEKNFDLINTVSIPQWEGLNDYLFLYQRNIKE